MSLTLTHSNETGGTTVLNDGTKVHWSQSGSNTVVIAPNGVKTVIPPYTDHEILQRPEIAENATDEMRSMTADEEAVWANNRG